jgi:hypothetical protein
MEYQYLGPTLETQTTTEILDSWTVDSDSRNGEVEL